MLLPALVVTEVLCGPVAALGEIVKVAVIWVGLTTTMLVCLSPTPCNPTCEPLMKFVPVSVTLTDVPRAPLEGVTELSVGKVLAGVTVNVAELLVPPAVVTETLEAPSVAPAAIVKVAVALVALTTDTFETVIPLPLLKVRGATKPVPVRVTGTDEPCDPLEGLMEVRVGTTAADVMLKETLPLVPPAVVTDTLCPPVAAFAAIVKVAVAVVALTTDTFETVIPLPLLRLRGATKPVPVRVTGIDAPWAPVEGLMEVRVGTTAAAVTLKETFPLVPADVVTERLCCPTVAFAATFSVAVI